eukprot:scaffold99000_cov21-Cyclotella_meneghiniana.AAC.2
MERSRFNQHSNGYFYYNGNKTSVPPSDGWRVLGSRDGVKPWLNRHLRSLDSMNLEQPFGLLIKRTGRTSLLVHQTNQRTSLPQNLKIINTMAKAAIKVSQANNNRVADANAKKAVTGTERNLQAAKEAE